MNGLGYLIQANCYLVLFFGFYLLFLRKETFFNLNRFYLLTTTFLSFLIPVLDLNVIVALPVAQQMRSAGKVFSADVVPVTVTAPAIWSLSVRTLLMLVYFSIAGTLLVRLAWRILSVYKTADTFHAWTFFNRIVVPEDHDERATIRAHETVHARQWHSVDVIFYELVLIVNWANPVCYFLKRAAAQVHEYIADEQAAGTRTSKSEYAQLLMTAAFGVSALKLASPFYNKPLIKERINMLYQNRSGKTALWKYGLSAPLFAGMLVLSSAFSADKAPVTRISRQLEQAAENVADAILTRAPLPNDFIKRNPGVKLFSYSSMPDGPELTIVLKTGKKEVYQLGNALSLKQFVARYGALPPMPPDAPMPPKKTEMVRFPPPAPRPPRPKVEKVVLFPPPAGSTTPLDANTVDQAPAYPGGTAALVKFIGDNYEFSAAAKEAKLSGKVYMSFTVDTDGSLTDIKVLRDLGMGTGDEAVRVLKKMPKWTPGVNKGQPVRVAYTLPLSLETAK